MTDTNRRPTVILFDSFGPYHIARLHAARAAMHVIGVEVGGLSDDYPWFDAEDESEAAIVRLFPQQASGAVPTATLRRALFALLDRIDPAVVAVPGWGTRAALAALAWCAARRRPAIMMCDSTLLDRRRRPASEYLKRGVVSGCAAGFASGQRSVAYLEALGMPGDQVWTGYDVVDNRHFAEGAARARAHSDHQRAVFGLPPRYLFAIGRLIPKKNFDNLLRAFALYRTRAGAAALPLVLGGSGPLDADLRALAAQLGIADHVVFAGHVSYDDLPVFYGLATGFALVSIGEQWGLVLNEAIACDLPVLVTEGCGAAPDLVQPGYNGLLCTPDPQSIADGLLALAHTVDTPSFGRRSGDIAKKWDLDAFVTGLAAADLQARHSVRVPKRLPVMLASVLASLGSG